MSDTTQDATVRLKWVMDESGTRSVNALTGAILAAASAEDVLRPRAESANRAVSTRGPAAFTPRPRRRRPAPPEPDDARMLATKLMNHPGAKQHGLTPAVLARLPDAGVRDVGRDLGLVAPKPYPSGDTTRAGNTGLPAPDPMDAWGRPNPTRPSPPGPRRHPRSGSSSRGGRPAGSASAAWGEA